MTTGQESSPGKARLASGWRMQLNVRANRLPQAPPLAGQEPEGLSQVSNGYSIPLSVEKASTERFLTLLVLKPETQFRLKMTGGDHPSVVSRGTRLWGTVGLATLHTQTIPLSIQLLSWLYDVSSLQT
jgi:hypothetical protein